ncbi:hypothetical protein LTR66_013273, partial [Elasticomyces elasticus]
LFVLEFGADKFVDHTAIVATRTGVSQALIGLLTAGAEWEELVVVVASIARHRSSLAIGNIVGSAVSNILGAFSLGLLFYKGQDGIVFDRSSRIYSALLLGLTVVVAALTAWKPADRGVKRAVGGVLCAVFAVYVASIAWAIGRGKITAPEGSDSDSDSDRTGDSSEAASDSDEEQTVRPFGSSVNSTPARTNGNLETSPLLQNDTRSPTKQRSTRPPRHTLWYHTAMLIVGFLAICASSYQLSYAASAIVDFFGMSDVLFGVVVLSLATTLPEKFVASISGLRGHAGILVANTVGSNIFLLSLCMGVLWSSTDGEYDRESVNNVELGVLVGSTVALTLTVWFGARWSRWIGGAMVAGYVAFIVVEFVVARKV